MSFIADTFWKWPNGLIWKVTHRLTITSRKRKFTLFLHEMQPTFATTILDVGVSGVASAERAENFLEEWYEHPEKITALGVSDLTQFAKRYPKVKTVQGDGKHLPFADKQFDIVFSNAVLEHVGTTKAQEQFVHECLRVGKRVFLTTPSRSFPVESHTLLPFIHWLPIDVRNMLYYLLGRKNEGKPGALTLLYAQDLKKLFPTNVEVKIIRQRMFGMTSVLIAKV